jgi:hypothetical protein
MLILTKACTCCGEEKEFTEFTRNKGSKWGFHNKCKACCAKRVKTYYKNNPSKKSESCKKYYSNNHSECRERQKEYRKNNWEDLRPKHVAMWSKRRASKLERTPSWLSKSDLKQIEALYKLSNRLSNCLGIKFHVDHIIPLQGKFVSGLHIPNNLRVIPAIINLQKGNK